AHAGRAAGQPGPGAGRPQVRQCQKTSGGDSSRVAHSQQGTALSKREIPAMKLTRRWLAMSPFAGPLTA
ncbi:MAG: hypothetical protein ABIO88_14075, partial [Burkholderiaceae bacterium]